MAKSRLLIIGLVVLLSLACGSLGSPTATPAVTPKTFSGSGDTVLEVGDLSQYTKCHLTHNGTSNFIVRPYYSDGDYGSSLVNEIGKYDGTVMWDKKTSQLEIKADGKWTITVSR